jgi:hypothetical protein
LTKTTGTRAELIEELQTRGAWAAYQASLEVCQNTKAPANARSQAASNILRAAGFFATRTDDGRVKEPSEMSADELNESVRTFRELQAAKSKNTLFD